VTLDFNTVRKAYVTGQLAGRLTTLKYDGVEQPVIPRDIQLDPVKDTPLHVDFLRVDERTRIDVDVPVRFLNEETSPGLKQGGVLNVVRHEVELSCPATRIPEFIELDLIEAQIGDTLHISAVNLPEGVSPTITDRDFTIATIVAPRTMKAAGGADGADDGADGDGAEGDAE